MKYIKILSIILVISIILCGCSVSNDESAQIEEEITVSSSADDIINTSDMFTSRDLNYDYSKKDTYKIELKDNASSSTSKNVKINKNTITINSEGIYILAGSLTNGQIIIDADEKAKVQLVLKAVSINCDESAAIFCKKAKKLFITTDNDSTLSNKKDFKNSDEKINGVIYSKSDLTLNGNKKLTINACYGNSITAKDDLVISSGEYDFTAKNHTIKANDSVRIKNASLNLNATKDAIHSENDEITKGFVYIESGDITINAKDDGIKSSSAVKICGGNIDIQTSNEGIEGRFIDVTDGTININSNDDGFNASDKSQDNSTNTNTDNKSSNEAEAQSTPATPPSNQELPQDMPTPPNRDFKEQPNDIPNGEFGKMDNSSNDCSLLISGGKITVNASGDGLDSNGIIKITGGETVVFGAENNGNSAFDYQTQATITGGSLIAVGMSGMAEGFSNSSTQGSILYNLDEEGSANDKIALKKGSKILISTTAKKNYNSILISCAGIEKGKYTINAGDKKIKIKLKSITYSNQSENGFGKMGDKGFDKNGDFDPNNIPTKTQ